MKIKSTFHALVFFMAALIFSMPIVSLAQENLNRIESKDVTHQISVDVLAKTAAEHDAEADTKRIVWVGGNFVLGIVGGCLLGSVGLLGAYIYEPSPPISRLLGKSPEYTMFYTDAYKAKARDLRLKYASIGCISGSVVAGGVTFFYLYNLQMNTR